MSTAISWTNETWNPVVGCEPVSAGCDNCYAKALHDMRYRAHLAGKKMLPQYHVPFEDVQLMPDRIEQPLHWSKPRRVFVNSVSDLFHKDVAEDFLDRVFAVMALTPRHTYQILTKRPARMLRYISTTGRAGSVAAETGQGPDGDRRWPFIRPDDMPWPLPNVWLGVSVEHQAAADVRIPQLLQTPAAVRFLSCEPLLGPVDLDGLASGSALAECDECGPSPKQSCESCLGQPRVDWVIVGGESGDNRRDMDLAWLRSIIEQCQAAGVATFVKQDSGRKSEQRGRIPDDLWIREYPKGVA